AMGEREKNPDERIKHFESAVGYLDKAENPQKALDLARKRLRAGASITEKLKAQLLVAKATYKVGAEQDSLDQLAILSKTLERQRQSMRAEDYAAVAGETHFLLGEEARRKFDDFNVVERAGNVADNITVKS